MSFESFNSWAAEPANLNPALTIVVPTFNESERILPTIVSIAAEMSHVTTDFEIVVSDDGSSDGTPDLIRALGMRNVTVLDPGVNLGKGAAVRAGVRAARGQRILFSDADMSTPMREIGALQARLDAGADVAIGSRAVDGAQEQSKSALRRAFSWGWRRITKIGLGLDIADTQCGFKLFTRDAAMQLFGTGRVNGFSFDAELLFLASRYGLDVAEVPVEWFDAPGSTVRPVRVAVQFLRDVLSIRWSALRGAYPRTPKRADARLRLAVVTAVPPSTATLTEYGQHLIDELAAKPEVDDVVVLAEDAHGIPEDEEGVRYLAGWTFGSLTTPWRVLRHVRREQPDVVYFNAHFTSFGSGKVAAALGLCTPALVRAASRSKSIVLLHNIVDTVDLEGAGYGSNPFVTRVLENIGRALTRVLLRSNAVVTTMPEYVDILRERYGATNVYLTPHGTFDAPSAPATESTDGPFRVLAFGKFGTYKRVEDLIAAQRVLLGRGYDVECVIAGTDSPNAPGYLAAAERDAIDVAGVHFTGYVEESDIPTLFTDAHVVVFPYSSTTGSSGPLHQTGSYARAAVVPRVGDFVDLIEREGFHASVFEPGNVESLAEAIARLADDTAERQRLAHLNYLAACSLPLRDVADWHIAHAEAVVAA